MGALNYVDWFLFRAGSWTEINDIRNSREMENDNGKTNANTL